MSGGLAQAVVVEFIQQLSDLSLIYKSAEKSAKE